MVLLSHNDQSLMLSLVDACLGRLPTVPSSRPLLRLLAARPAAHHSLRSPLPLAAAAAAVSEQVRHARASSTPGAVPEAAEDFFASSAVTFSGLGLGEEVCGALQQAGYSRPAHAQVSARCHPRINHACSAPDCRPLCALR